MSPKDWVVFHADTLRVLDLALSPHLTTPKTLASTSSIVFTAADQAAEDTGEDATYNNRYP